MATLKHDLDGDGIVTAEELDTEERMLKLENSNRMADQQRLICWVSSISSIAFICFSMSPLVSEARIETVTALLSTYIIANLGIVATFMTTSAWASRSK
tara:strand:+ start:214 stop:510 length:297 start_codon:yes stop_codon:yes gene_type:complete